MLVIIHLISNSLFLLNLADYVSYVDLMFLEVRLEVGEHGELEVSRLVLDRCRCI